MKSLAPYFGNRFATVAAKTKKSARKAKLAVSEMEALENRILLSGITAGKDYKSVSFTDADGDKVTVSMSNGGTFQLGLIGGDTNDNDIDTLTITKGGTSAILNITVAAQKIDGGYTEAISNVGSIVVGTGVTAMKAINSNGAALDSINLGTATLGSIKLSATNAIALDRNAAGGNQSAVEVDLGDVTAKSISTIQIVSSKKVQNDGGMNFDGAITTTTGSLTLIGGNSLVQGQVEGAGTTFKTAGFGAGGGTKSSGDITLNFALGSTVTGTFESTGGNIHIGGATGTTFNGAKFIAAKTISGTGSATTDVVTIAGSVTDATFTAGTTFAGLKVTGGDVTKLTASAATSIGDLEATNGDLGNLTLTVSDAAGTIGNITAADDVTLAANISAASIGNISGDKIDGATITATTGNIGNITATAGSITALVDITATKGNIGNVTASVNVIGDIIATAGNIGNITATAGDITGDITIAKGNIGNITAGGTLNQVTNATLTVTLGSVGNISVGTLGDAIDANNSIGNITISAGGTNGKTIEAGNSTVGSTTAGGIGNISVAGVISATVQTLTGSIGNITSTAGGTTAAITSASSIGNISVTGTTQGIGAAITATAGNIGNVTASVTTGNTGGAAIAGDITAAAGTIGNITASATTGDAIYSAGTCTFSSLTSIGNISATATGADGDGVIGALTVTSKVIGNVTILGTESVTGVGDEVGISGALTLGSTTATTGTGSIGNISVTGSIGGTVTLNGRASGSGVAGGSVGDFTHVQQSSGQNLNIDLDNIYQIGNISATASAVTKGTTTLDIDSNTSGVFIQTIGNITGSDIVDVLTTGDKTLITSIGNITAGQSVIMAAIAAASGNNLTIGNITATSQDVTLGAISTSGAGALTIGNISAGDDFITDGITSAKSVTIGNISITDDVTINGNIASSGATATTIGTLSFDRFDLGGGDRSIGSATNTGAIGLISAGSRDEVTADDQLTFSFTTFNGKTNATKNTTLAVDYTVASGLTDIQTQTITTGAGYSDDDLTFVYVV